MPFAGTLPRFFESSDYALPSGGNPSSAGTVSAVPTTSGCTGPAMMDYDPPSLIAEGITDFEQEPLAGRTFFIL